MDRQQILDTLKRSQLGFTGLLLQGHQLTDADDLACDLLREVCRLREI